MTQKQMQVEYVPLSKIEQHKDVPNIRSKIGKLELKELIESIKAHGVKSPLSCWASNGKIYLESGFRRLEAAREAKLKEVPVVVRDYEQPIQQALVGNMVENIEREDVNGLDLARRIQRLMDMKMPKEEIGRRISRSQSWISQTLAFLDEKKVDPKLQKMVAKGDLTLNEGKDIAKLDLKHQAKIGQGLVQAKEIGDKGGKSRIKEGVKRAGRKHSTARPSARRIQVERNKAFVLMDEMRKASDGDTQDYSVVKGVYNSMKWVLGEVDDLRLDRLGKEYDLKFGKDGLPAPKMKADSKKSPSKKQPSVKKQKKK